jgi:aminopeptidase N
MRAEGARQTLVGLLKRPAFLDAIASGALDGLAELQDPEAWPAVLAQTKYGMPPVARRTALMALARLAEAAEKKTVAVDVIARALRDPSFRTQMASFDAAIVLGDRRLVGPLSSTPFSDGRSRRSAKEAIRALRATAPNQEVVALRKEVDGLKAETRALRERLDALDVKKKRK